MDIEETLQAIGDYLETLQGLAGIGIVVDKQQDMESEMAAIQSKNKGYVITVGEVSNRNEDGAKTRLGVSLKFGVTVYSPKVVTSPGKRGGELRTDIIKGLHAHKIDQETKRCDYIKYDQGRVFLEKNKNGYEFMVHAMSFTVPTKY